MRKKKFFPTRETILTDLLVLILVVIGCLVLSRCNGVEPPPEPQPCDEAREMWPECEATGGKWVEYPQRAVDPAHTCDCDCGPDAVFMEDRGCVPDEPPPTTTVPPTTTTTIPEPPPGPPPSDYVHIKRTPHIVEELEIQLQFATWAGWRDPEYVADHCAWGCADGADPLFDVTASEMAAFAETGRHLVVEGRDLQDDLPIENRRCDPNNPKYDPRFLDENGKCTRSNVRKVRMTDYRTRLDGHMAIAVDMRDVAQGDPIRQTCAYDSIKGWCTCRNDAGGPQ